MLAQQVPYIETVTVHSKCSRIPPSNSIHFVTRMRRSLVISVDLRVSLCEQNHRKWQRAVRPRVCTSFWQFRFFTQLHKQKSNGVVSGDSNSCTSLTAQNQAHVNMNFLTMTDIITSHNIDLFPESPLHSKYCKGIAYNNMNRHIHVSTEQYEHRSTPICIITEPLHRTTRSLSVQYSYFVHSCKSVKLAKHRWNTPTDATRTLFVLTAFHIWYY